MYQGLCFAIHSLLLNYRMLRKTDWIHLTSGRKLDHK